MKEDEDDVDVHRFMGQSFVMHRDHYEFTRLILPLQINAPHTGFRKIERTNHVFEYNEKFIYVLGADIILQDVLSRPDMPVHAKTNVMLPTKDGLYLGALVPIDLKAGANMKSHGMDRARKGTRAWHGNRELPFSMIDIHTTVPARSFADERAIYERWHNLLRAPKETGLLLRLCQHFINPDTYSLDQQDAEALKALFGAVNDMVRGPAWAHASVFKHAKDPPGYQKAS